MQRRATGTVVRRRLTLLLVAPCLFAVGCWLRVSNHGQVFAFGTVLPLTADATYHLHRSLQTFASFPHAPVFDRLMNWPEGAYSHVADGYDVLSAALARALVPANDELGAASVMVYVPVLFGLITAWLARSLCARLIEPEQQNLAELLTLAAALLLPIGLFVSLLGRTDHHCAEALCVCGLCLWLCRRFPLQVLQARSLGFELAGAGWITAAMYLFNGSPVYIALCVPVLVAATTFERDASARWLGSGTLALTLGALLTALLYGVALRQHGQLFSYAFPSLLQPALLLGMAAICAGAVLVAGRVRFDASERWPWKRARALLAISAGLVIALSCVSAIRLPVVAAVTEHLFRKEPWLQGVAEALPLFSRGVFTRNGWETALLDFGPFAPLTIVLFPIAMHRSFATQPGRACTFAWFAGWLLLLTLVQSRFARSLYPFLAVWTALGAAGVVRMIERTAYGDAAAPGARRGLLQAGVAFIVVLALATTRGAEGYQLPRTAKRVEAPQRVSLFLAGHNPVRPDGTRAGALAPWSLGHQLMWPAKTGVVANGFLFHIGREMLARSQAALTSTEANAIALMRERDLQWLVTGAALYQSVPVRKPRGTPLLAGAEGPVVNLAYVKQLPMAASILGGGGVPGADVAHLTRLTPRFAAFAPGEPPLPVPAYWVFERVRGATIAGRAAPDSKVIAQLDLQAEGKRFPYAAWVKAQPDGRFELPIALWSGMRDANVQTGASYHLQRAELPPVEVSVSESDVRKGKVIEVHD